ITKGLIRHKSSSSCLCVNYNSAPLLRRNSYTPLSSHDQVKRPRLYSAGNWPWLPLTPSPTTLMHHGALLLQQSQVSVRT
uniref:Uncharacterized protein n=1 Tax=Sinocyclocheilus anshuiensis TaxID=1608454 RepID=A0A671T7I8_9TELE